MAAEWMSQLSAPLPQGLASLLSNRRRRNQVLQARGLPPRRQTMRPITQRPTIPLPPPGGKHGGLLGYQGGGRTMNPRAGGAAARRELLRRKYQHQVPTVPSPSPSKQPFYTDPGGWQEGGPVGAAPEEVAMASEIFARATPEQQAQITGGGGGPGMMDEEAAIGEALAMAMGGGGGPPMNGGPPMGGMI